MNGFELVEYTKTHYPAIPVLVMTGRHSPETEKRAISIGASRYIVKPFDVDAIKNFSRPDSIQVLGLIRVYDAGLYPALCVSS